MTSNAAETDDDERPLQYEEEEQSNTDDEQNELNDLKADANMPLDQIYHFYSKNVPTITNNFKPDEDDASFSSSEIDDEDDEDSDDDDDDEGDRRHHLLHMNGALLPDNDDDSDDSLYEPEIVKQINVGDEYQAHIESEAKYDSSNEYCDDREVPDDELLWSSSSLNDSDNENIDEYLEKIHAEYPSSDDEISLQTLLHCQFNTELALAKFRQQPKKNIYSYPAWSLTEIEKFEEGLREYGKSFFQISLYKCQNRSVRELVYFFYQWKKSERYQMFFEAQHHINSLPCVSHIIEKFIEEQEQHLCTAPGVVNSTSSSSFLSNDFKLHAPISSNSTISFVTIHQEQTTTTTTTPKRSYDQVDSNDEPSAKKHSITTNSSSTEATTTIA